MVATTLYFHNANSTETGLLPSTTRMTFTPDLDVDGAEINRSMNTTIGAAQASLSATPISSIAQKNYYFTRFVSQPMSGTVTISANTWTYDFAALQSNLNTNFCGSGTGNSVNVTCYVWRPTTGTIVGTICNGPSAAAYAEPDLSNVERSEHGTFTGAQVTGIQDGDLIVFEVAFQITMNTTSSTRTITFYYDGTTENRTVNSTVTNHASFIETPQAITFGAGGGGGGSSSYGGPSQYNGRNIGGSQGLS